MRSIKCKLFVLALIFLTGLVVPEGLRARAAQGGTEKAKTRPSGTEPIVIKSKTLEVDNKLKVVTFTGEVNAKKDDFVLECEKMLVYYESLPNQGGRGETETKINKIVATGQVRINRVQGGVATADKAVYYQREEKMVLTGKPVVREGKDFVEGDRITMFLKESRSLVESDKDKKVRAVIFPKEEKR